MITLTHKRYNSAYKLMEVINALLFNLGRFDQRAIDMLPFPGQVQFYVVGVEKKLGLKL